MTPKAFYKWRATPICERVWDDAAVATMPDGRNFEVMASATEGSRYALACIRAAGVDDGSEVLVCGGTGAIGSGWIARPQRTRSISDFIADSQGDRER